jgi:uncharacterized repeat protein (TIGR01451 family)
MQSWLSRRILVCAGRSIVAASLNSFVLACLFPATSWAQSVNLVETFKNTTAPNWVLGPTGESGNPGAILTAPNVDTAGNGWLRLTQASGSQRGFAYYNTPFPAISGVSISFEYAMWGGTALGANTGDGISVFLFDAITSPFKIGVDGGSLGYANGCSSSNSSVADYTTGLSGGYLGVGIDRYGNFVNTGDKCHNGFDNNVRPNTIVLRGSAANNYNYLTYANTPELTTGTTTRGTANKVFIDIIPTQGVYSVTVRIQTAGATSTVLNKALTNNPPPNNLKLGFAASTGGATNNHEIRNVTITTPTDLKISTANYPQTALAGNQVTYQIVAVNKGPNTDPAARINDTLPSQLTNITWTCVAAGGAQCSDPSGNGSINQAVSLPVNGTVTYTVTGTVAATTANNTTIQNTATIATSLPFTDINTSDNSTTVNTTTSTGKLLFVKRVTSVSTSETTNNSVNPNNNVPLNQFVDDTTSSYRDLDNDLGWPSSYLLGAINPGTVKNSNTIEYTIYFLNAGNVDLNNIKICDRIAPYQTYVANSLKLKLGSMTNEINLTDTADASTIDRGQFIGTSGTVPTACNLKGTNSNGVVVVDLTGTITGGAKVQPDLSIMPRSNATSSQTNTIPNSYGYIRFKTKVN